MPSIAFPQTRVPDLPAHWQSLDLSEILRRPAAFVSISQVKSVYEAWGVQGAEAHRDRGNLEATVRVVRRARQARNFRSFHWIRYDVFRKDYARTVFDTAQYTAWTRDHSLNADQELQDSELVNELKELQRPGDHEYFEVALQSSFVGTILPLELARKKVETIVFTGMHLDWCIEGNARSARDLGYLPIVIGDACGCRDPGDDQDAMRRISAYFAPVISSEKFEQLLSD